MYLDLPPQAFDVSVFTEMAQTEEQHLAQYRFSQALRQRHDWESETRPTLTLHVIVLRPGASATKPRYATANVRIHYYLNYISPVEVQHVTREDVLPEVLP